MELIKNTIRVGNSAGVLLPKEFLNTQVKVVLQPLNIEKDVIEILSKEILRKDFFQIIHIILLRWKINIILLELLQCTKQ